MKIYTKTGDTGMTSLVGGTRVSKASLRLDTYGTVDELNSFVGLLQSKIGVKNQESRAKTSLEDILTILHSIQNKLFNLGAYLATESQESKVSSQKSKVVSQEDFWIKEGDVEEMEHWIDALSADLPPMKGFILPAGNERVALAHICRTITRRLERRMVELSQESGTKSQEPGTRNQDDISLKYVNRLSDFWFILARKVAQIDKCDIFLWEK